MAKQTLVFESPKELSLKDGMLVIADRETEETTLRSLEDIQMIMVDNHSVSITMPMCLSCLVVSSTRTWPVKSWTNISPPTSKVAATSVVSTRYPYNVCTI